MKITLGNTLPTADGPAADPQAAPPCPAPPAGYWVNPANCTQWLPQDQAAQIGDVCLFGTGLLPGRLRVGGNQSNTKLYCGSFFASPVTDSVVFYGGAAVIAFFALPAPYRWWVAGPLAGLAALGAVFGRADG